MVVFAVVLCGFLGGCEEEQAKDPTAEIEVVDPVVEENPVLEVKPALTRVTVDTSMGKIVIELYPDKAPITVKNFLRYTREGFYDGLVFHRVWPGFMIQGGGFNPKLVEKQTHKPIKNEAKNGLSNLRGTVAMARDPRPNSATSQFFINVVNNAGLDYGKNVRDPAGYAVFGKVVKGMKVVDAIVKVPRITKISKKGQALEDCPVKAVVIKSAKVVDSN